VPRCGPGGRRGTARWEGPENSGPAGNRKGSSGAHTALRGAPAAAAGVLLLGGASAVGSEGGGRWGGGGRPGGRCLAQRPRRVSHWMSQKGQWGMEDHRCTHWGIHSL